MSPEFPFYSCVNAYGEEIPKLTLGLTLEGK